VGAFWSYLACQATCACVVGVCIKFDIYRNFQAIVVYRYIQTIAPSNISGHNGRSCTNMIGDGLTLFYGGKDNTNKYNPNIKDKDAT
ncbi:OmpA family protein, partial [Francisella tularensis subsp. holarctica]|nr:OmpA family protein [Francisella tularensis subsp. holarctica]